MKKNKTLIIIISIIVVLAVASTVLMYLFFATDTFKSDKELFAKYMMQNTEVLKKMTDLKANEIHKGLKDEEKYESNTQISATYSEGGEISSPINKIGAQIDIQKDNLNKYLYADAQILFDEEEYLESEIIKDQELYGIRFSDVTKQFMTVKNDDKLEKIADEIGIDLVDLQDIIKVIDGTTTISEEIISSEEIDNLKEKYLGILTETVSNGTFSSQKKAMITYNNTTTKTNAYAVNLSSEQVEKMLLEILNNLKEEEIGTKIDEYKDNIDEIIKKITEEIEIPTIKISLFEQNQKTLRTVIEIGNYKIIIENIEENEQLKSQIQFFISTDEGNIEYNIEISKIIIDNQEEFEMIFETGEEEEKNKITLLNQVQKQDEEINSKISIKYEKDIIESKITIENIINLESDFEKKQTLEETNNIILNDIDELRRLEIINVLKEKVPEKVSIRLNLLAKALEIINEEPGNVGIDMGITQVEINKFNAKFEFYAGESVAAENVKTLLGIVKDNLANCEITQIDSQGDENTNIKPEDIEYSIKLTIEKDKTNEEAINQVIEKIVDKKKYKVSISYKEQNGLIDCISIDEVKN